MFNEISFDKTGMIKFAQKNHIKKLLTKNGKGR